MHFGTVPGFPHARQTFCRRPSIQEDRPQKTLHVHQTIHHVLSSKNRSQTPVFAEKPALLRLRSQPNKSLRQPRPIRQHSLPETTVRALYMSLNQRLQTILRLNIKRAKAFCFNKFRMIPLARHEGSISIINPRQSARHASAKVHPNPAQNNNHTASHIFAAMVANSFNNSSCTRIPHREPLTSPTPSKEFASRRTIKRHIA